MSIWSVDLCAGWARIGQLQNDAFAFNGVERFNELGEWTLEFPDAAPAWSWYDDDDGVSVAYTPRDVDTIRLVEDGVVRYAGFVAEPSQGNGGVERKYDVAGVRWSMGGPDIWDLLRRRLAFPVPATATPSSWASSHDVNTGVASTVLANYFADNLGSTALAARQITGFSVVDGTVGASGTWSARLQTLYELARRILADAELTIRWTVSVTGGITASIQAPRNLSESVVLSDQDDLTQIHTRSFPVKSTWVLAGGDGEGTGRIFASADAGVSGLDRRERFVNASSLTENYEVQAIAAANQRVDAETWMATGEIADAVTERLGFGRTIFVGDKVTIQATGQRFTIPITSIAWSVTPERQVVRPTLGESTPDALKGLLKDVADLEARTENEIA